MYPVWVALLISYVYAFGILLVIEAIGRRFRWPLDTSRKLVHIAAGMWIWGILYLFHDWRWGLVPFATFILLNYLFYKKQIFKQMDAADSSPGTVYFAISITLLFGLLWRTGDAPDLAPVAAAGVMAMTWGDAFASLVGRKWGRHVYRISGHPKSWEGSAAMALFSFAAIYLTLWLLPGSSLSPNSPIWTAGRVLCFSSSAAALATIAEALSPRGTDNLSVPILTSALLYLLR